MTINELVTKDTNEQSLLISNDAKEYIKSSRAKSTLRVYQSDFRIFSSWCESRMVENLPATSETVACFLTEEARRGIKPATLERRLAAIKLAHESWNFDNPTDHKIIKTLLKGIKRTHGSAQNKKSPITAERLESMIAHCPDTLIGLRDKALLLLGFAGAFRRSELMALTFNDIERTDEGIKVIIRKSKTDQEGKGHTIAILNGVRFRVVDTLYKWFKAANITDGYLLRPIRKGDHVQTNKLTCRAVANIVKLYAMKCGFNIDKFSGHSLRSGFITSGAQSGADMFKLMEVSRHKNPDTVMGYVRESKLFDNHAGEKFL